MQQQAHWDGNQNYCRSATITGKAMKSTIDIQAKSTLSIHTVEDAQAPEQNTF